jgi:hypothetical protein
VSTKIPSATRQQGVTLAAIAFIIALVLWQVQGLFFITYPLRLFVTMIHELAHGLAAAVTGGSFLHFEVTKRGAGLAYTSGGWRFLIIQAGYLGTALFGAALLFVTHRVQHPGRVAVGLGLMVGILTLAYTGLSFRNLNLIELGVTAAALGGGLYLLLSRDQDERQRALGFIVVVAGLLLLLAFAGGGNTLTLAAGLTSAALLALIGLRGGRTLQVFALTFLSFITGLQAITDAWVLLRIVALPDSMMPLNDAQTMARVYGGPAGMRALLWVALDVLIFRRGGLRHLRATGADSAIGGSAVALIVVGGWLGRRAERGVDQDAR